jgi:hypothetical protein
MSIHEFDTKVVKVTDNFGEETASIFDFGKPEVVKILPRFHYNLHFLSLGVL